MVGPEIKFTSTPGFERKPLRVASVFSWAPPTTSRVMTWVTRMARSVWLAFEVAQPLNDVRGFGSVGVGGGQIGFVIFDCLVGFVLAPGDFGEAEGDLRRVGVGLLRCLEVGACGIELLA